MRLLWFFPALAVLAGPAIHAEPLRVGLVEFVERNDIGLQNARQIIPEMLVAHLKRLGAYQLNERIILKSVMEEQALGLTGAVDASTAARVGKILGMQAIITGTSMKVGRLVVVSGRVIDVETSEILASGTIKFRRVEDIEEELEGLAYQLCGLRQSAFERVRFSRLLARSSYGLLAGPGYAVDHTPVKNYSGAAPLSLGTYFHSRRFDGDLYGLMPLGGAAAISATASYNPFLQFGAGVGWLYTFDNLGDEGRAEAGKFCSEAKYSALLLGLNYRASPRMRAAVYTGATMSGWISFKDTVGNWYKYDIKNYITSPIPAAWLASITYSLSDQYRLKLQFVQNGGSGKAASGVPAAPDKRYMDTKIFSLMLGYNVSM
jgi:hypothetical protein